MWQPWERYVRNAICLSHVSFMCRQCVIPMSQSRMGPFELVVHPAYWTYVSKPYDRRIQWHMADT
jgi:hypothetical protein